MGFQKGVAAAAGPDSWLSWEPGFPRQLTWQGRLGGRRS